MTDFTYQAVDTAGALHTGTLSAASRASALETLSSRGLFPVSMEEGAAKTKSPERVPKHTFLQRFSFNGGSQLAARELLVLVQSLASLLKAGLTIDRALQIATSLAPRPNSRQLAERLLQQVRAGKTFSAALAVSEQKLPEGSS